MEQSRLAYASDHDHRRPPAAHGVPRPISQTRRGSVLVVDDDPLIADFVCQTLAAEGYAVRSAPDGDAALDAIVGEPPDLVVSDIMMPKLDGVALAQRLRERGITVPVVLISAVYQDVDIPGVRFLPKPFDLDHLIDVVAHAVGQGG
jgi:DNA-binding response OmpR family regulator